MLSPMLVKDSLGGLEPPPNAFMHGSAGFIGQLGWLGRGDALRVDLREPDGSGLRVI